MYCLLLHLFSTIHPLHQFVSNITFHGIQPRQRNIDWLIDWLTDWLIYSSIHLVIDWLMDWLIQRFLHTDRWIDWWIDLFIYWLIRGFIQSFTVSLIHAQFTRWWAVNRPRRPPPVVFGKKQRPWPLGLNKSRILSLSSADLFWNPVEQSLTVNRIKRNSNRGLKIYVGIGRISLLVDALLLTARYIWCLSV